VALVLRFWCFFIAATVWSDGIPQYLNTLVPFAVVATILGAFFLLLRRYIH
jgi:hypothetical protein